ncbi:hypothetical protein QOZ80_5AG0398640 [Eleusine coracana subsp. coracana]|nr:hypothetical protein QOZ80_5AG0398640 [Eleusine coracana subsp. coracana]
MSPPPEAMLGCPLPSDLLLDIIARTDLLTLIRCAASCKPLRREILGRAFIRRVSHQHGSSPDAIVPRVLGFLNLNHKSDTLPWPPPSFSSLLAAASVDQVAPPLITPRLITAGTDEDLAGTTRAATPTRCYKHVLLTSADDVLTGGGRFVVVTFDFVELVKGLRSITVRTLSSSSSSSSSSEEEGSTTWTWSTTTVATHPSRPSRFPHQMPTGNAVTTGGGVVHWLLRQVYDDDCCIFTYNVVTHAPDGWIEVPLECRASSQLHLASSPPSTTNVDDDDGMSSRTLSLIMEAADHRSISVWVLLQSSVVSAPRSGTVMLMPDSGYLHHWQSDQGSVVVLDLDTMEMRTVNKDKQAFLYEVDLLSRMRSF